MRLCIFLKNSTPLLIKLLRLKSKNPAPFCPRKSLNDIASNESTT
jgi:hypothetical protein